VTKSGKQKEFCKSVFRAVEKHKWRSYETKDISLRLKFMPRRKYTYSIGQPIIYNCPEPIKKGLWCIFLYAFQLQILYLKCSFLVSFSDPISISPSNRIFRVDNNNIIKYSLTEWFRSNYGKKIPIHLELDGDLLPFFHNFKYNLLKNLE
jgi:hypothetical protein